MGEQIFEKIKQFVDDEGWGYGISFNRETKIEADLGITGDDAAEFMIDYGKQFNVDVSKSANSGDWLISF
jgi:acyl carrier protein